MTEHSRQALIAVYIDPSKSWIGYEKGPIGHYICLLPTVVIRIRRRHPWRRSHGQ